MLYKLYLLERSFGSFFYALLSDRIGKIKYAGGSIAALKCNKGRIRLILPLLYLTA